MLFPYQVDVPMARWPVVNFLLIFVIVCVSASAIMNGYDGVDPYILDGWKLRGHFGHLFIHAGFLHLFGNMIFLWVSGNAVCAKIDNLPYLVAFFGLGLLAAATHNVFDGEYAVGASGAINGVVGMYLLLYPLNDVRCVWFIGVGGGQFSCSSIYMILLWLAFDIFGAALGGEGVAYYAHLGGFAAGAGVMAAALGAGWIEMTPVERSLPQVLEERRAGRTGATARRVSPGVVRGVPVRRTR